MQAILRAPAQAPRSTTQREVLRVRIRDLQVPVMVTIDAPYAPLCLDIRRLKNTSEFMEPCHQELLCDPFSTIIKAPLRVCIVLGKTETVHFLLRQTHLKMT